MLPRCLLDFSMDVGASVIGLALYEPFLKYCTLTNKAVGTI